MGINCVNQENCDLYVLSCQIFLMSEQTQCVVKGLHNFDEVTANFVRSEKTHLVQKTFLTRSEKTLNENREQNTHRCIYNQTTHQKLFLWADIHGSSTILKWSKVVTGELVLLVFPRFFIAGLGVVFFPSCERKRFHYLGVFLKMIFCMSVKFCYGLWT